MLEGRMSLARIRSLHQLCHGLLPLGWRGRDRVLESLVEANRIWHRSRTTKRKSQVAQVVHCHPRYNDQDVIFAETRDRLTESVVLVRVLGVEERDLHNRNIQWVGFRLKGCILVSVNVPMVFQPSHTALEAGPDAVVESALHTLALDPGVLQHVQHFIGYLLATHVRVLLFIIVARETVEAGTS